MVHLGEPSVISRVLRVGKPQGCHLRVCLEAQHWNTGQGWGWRLEFLFLSVSSPRFVVLVGDFLGFVFVLLKEKFAVSQVEITLLRLAGVVLCSCPQWMRFLLQHLTFGCLNPTWSVNSENVKCQRSGKSRSGRQGVLFLGHSGLNAEPGDQSCFL